MLSSLCRTNKNFKIYKERKKENLLYLKDKLRNLLIKTEKRWQI